MCSASSALSFREMKESRHVFTIESSGVRQLSLTRELRSSWPWSADENALHTRKASEAFRRPFDVRFQGEHFDVGSRVHCVRNRFTLRAFQSNLMHEFDSGPLEIHNRGNRRHHRCMHHARGVLDPQCDLLKIARLYSRLDLAVDLGSLCAPGGVIGARLLSVEHARCGADWL